MERVVAYLDAQRRALAAGSSELAAGDRVGVHHTRVAVRRARSTLRTFGPCFDGAPARQLDAVLVAHARRLGDVRDLEVMQGWFSDHFRRAGETVDGPLRSWITARVAEELAAEWATAVAALAAEPPDSLEERFAVVLGTARDGENVEKVAARAARRAAKRLGKAGGDPDALHEARKAAKRARYAAEALGDERAAARQERVQQVLGDHHDLIVASRWVAASAVPAEVVQSSLQLVVQLETRATDVLADLP